MTNTFDQLKNALQADDEYAWAWHCNLAMPIMDSIHCTPEQANKAGADLMQYLFKIDVRKFPQWHHDAATPPQASADDVRVEAFISEVRAELLRARSKFPGDRIMTIALAEEFGELCKAVLDESSANVRKEAVQTAVMCARVVLDGDGSVNEWRAQKGLDPLVAAERASTDTKKD